MLPSYCSKHWSEEIARLMMVKLILRLLILTARSTTSSMFVYGKKSFNWSTRIFILAREKILTNGGHFGGDRHADIGQCERVFLTNFSELKIGKLWTMMADNILF